MGSLKELLDRLWDDYADMNPQARTIHGLLQAREEQVINDHIALRTYDDPRVGIDALAQPFLDRGYRLMGHYTFPEKKLAARHYEPPNPLLEPPEIPPLASDRSATGLPKIFISELQVHQFSPSFRQAVADLLDQIPDDLTQRWDLPVVGRPWEVSYAEYERLRSESEYGAWLAAFGFRANHFSIPLDVGAMTSFESLEQFNRFVEDHGFGLNTSGGRVKGSPAVYLEQSSTLAANVTVAFTDGVHTIPGCYYEFAQRYHTPEGMLFQGFVAKSADKIFESTDQRDQ